MALIKCPECEKQISDTAQRCPDCGYMIDHDEMDELKSAARKVNKAKNIAQIIFIILAAIIILLVFKNCTEQRIKEGERKPLNVKTMNYLNKKQGKVTYNAHN